MADIGERLGGDDIHFSIDQPLRVIIGGPPHSGKSTLMNLLEDRFRYYQIPVELLDLDLASPTPLKTGFTEQREKRNWTPTLAKEARAMFEEAEGVQVVLGDSVGLITDINEIISQPADVAILLVSGGHGDYDTTYRKVVRKWKEYYEDIHKPLLVVLRSTMNPADESMFDPQDNYGVIVGMDRDAYDQRLISGHYRYEGTYPTNACLEGIVFEIAQSFDMKVRSATDPEHLEILNAKWPELKDKKTWTPPEGSVMGGLENAYYDERGIVPADQRAESFRAEADDWKALKATYEPYIGRKVNFITTYDDYGEMVTFKDIETIGFIDWDGEMGGSGEPEFRTKEGDRWMTIDYVKENLVEDTEAESFSADMTQEDLENLYETQDVECNECGGILNPHSSRGPYKKRQLCDCVWSAESFGADEGRTMADDDGRCVRCGSNAGFDYEGGCFTCLDVSSQKMPVNAEDDLTFQEWADQEMITHSGKESFDDWLDDELSHHGDNVSLHDWGNHELDSHYERYGAENMTRFEIMPSVDVEGIGIVSGPLVREYSYLTGGRIDNYDIYDDDAAEEIMSIPANDPRFPLQEGELELIEAMVYGFNHPRINDSWGELNEDGMFWATKVMETLSHYQAYAAEMANWSGRPKTSKPYRGLESKTRKRIKQEAAYSQMMIASLIGLGAGLWGVSKWRDSQRSL